MTERERGAHVEIIDPRGSPDGPLVPQRVLINGVDVGYIQRDSLILNVGGDYKAATVTLTLMPRKITIRGIEADEPISTAAAEYLDRLRASP